MANAFAVDVAVEETGTEGNNGGLGFAALEKERGV